MAPVALLALACVIATVSVSVSISIAISDSFTPTKSDSLVFAIDGRDIVVIDVKKARNQRFQPYRVRTLYQLALDEENERIYWTDSDGFTIGSNKWDGSNHTTLLRLSNEPGQGKPLSIAVVPSRNVVFFGLSGSNVIKSVGTDGRNESTVLSLGEKRVHQLAIDTKTQLIFYAFSNRSENFIGRVRYDGTGNRVLFPVGRNGGISLVVKDNRLYWTPSSGTLKSNKLDGSDQRSEMNRGFEGIGFIDDDYITISGNHLDRIATHGSNTSHLATADTSWGPFVCHNPSGAAGSPDAVSNSADADDYSGESLMNWTPQIRCLKMEVGTKINVIKEDNLGRYSLVVSNPPAGCNRDLGEFSADTIVPQDCVSGEVVVVNLQLTDIKHIIGGKHFRQFRFSCSGLGMEGTVQDLTTGNNPGQLTPIQTGGMYSDGAFSMFVTTDDVTSYAALTSSSSLNVSQREVHVVIQHSLAEGSEHRTLIPLQCDASSSSHSDKMTVWMSREGRDCVQENSLIEGWVVDPFHTSTTDATYAPLFPFDFEPGEEITLECSFRECPGVRSAVDLTGICEQSFDKLQACGGRFEEKEVGKRDAIVSPDDGSSEGRMDTRLVSATFTLT